MIVTRGLGRDRSPGLPTAGLGRYAAIAPVAPPRPPSSWGGALAPGDRAPEAVRLVARLSALHAVEGRLDLTLRARSAAAQEAHILTAAARLSLRMAAHLANQAPSTRGSRADSLDLEALLLLIDEEDASA